MRAEPSKGSALPGTNVTNQSKAEQQSSAHAPTTLDMDFLKYDQTLKEVGQQQQQLSYRETRTNATANKIEQNHGYTRVHNAE